MTLWRLTTYRVTTWLETTLLPSATPDAGLPLTPALFHVLLALADGEKHGYAILKELRAHDNSVLLSTGTLYGIISVSWPTA